MASLSVCQKDMSPIKFHKSLNNIEWWCYVVLLKDSIERGRRGSREGSTLQPNRPFDKFTKSQSSLKGGDTLCVPAQRTCMSLIWSRYTRIGALVLSLPSHHLFLNILRVQPHSQSEVNLKALSGCCRQSTVTEQIGQLNSYSMLNVMQSIGLVNPYTPSFTTMGLI